MRTTTITVEDDMYQKLKHAAVDERTTVREIIRKAIADYLARPGRR